MSPSTPAALAALLLFACASPERAPSSDPRPAWAAPELERIVSVRDGRTGEEVDLDGFLDALARADVVFLGEQHTDATTHRVQLAVYDGLIERRRGRVVLAMEMFERDVQATLDAYLAGQIDEQAFLASSRPWRNYRTAYRPMIERAREEGLPVVASNFPRPLRTRLSRGEISSFDELAPDERDQAPRELIANTPAYWRRVDNAIRGHLGMMGTSQDDERLYSAQSLWDNSMGEACALALDAHPGSSVLHVNGGFHSAYWDGTVRQLRLRRPDARILTVAISPTANPDLPEPAGAPIADYVVFGEARETDLSDGVYSVYVQRDVDYRLHLPETASAEAPVPLLIWFSDDGLTARDGLALWRDRLGDECAIAAVEAPYRETMEDLVEGGRWFWPDSFSTDVGVLQDAGEKIASFLLRHQPVDPDRICIAGEGTGATVAAALAVWGDLSAAGVAIAPRRFAKLKDLPLPLPDLRGTVPDSSLRVLARETDEAWWAGELEQHATIDFASSLAIATDDPWAVQAERESELRRALGLPPREDASAGPKRHMVATHARSRHWMRLRALELERSEGVRVAVVAEAPEGVESEAIETTVRAADYADGERLPRCPGPFGGTTVIVLPADTGAEELEAWLAIEAEDPLNARSRFSRLRIATTEGERALSAVLAKLSEEGRRNVLVVPAAFCADGATVRALRDRVRDFGDRMTLRWSPGLGGPSD